MAILCSRCRVFEADDEPITCIVLEGGPCSACKERAAIRQKIKQLEAEIQELKTRHDTLATKMNANHDPLIHKFPPEISSLIFRLCLMAPLDFGEFSLEDLRTSLAAPLRLGRVCRKWRQLAWATPNLWENVYLAIRPLTSHSLAESLPGLLREWLDRSGMLPLTISFLHYGWPHRNGRARTSSRDDFSDGSTSDGPVINTLENATELAIEILNSHSGRWRNLHITAVADIFELFSAYTQPNQLVNLYLHKIFNSSPQVPIFMMESEFSPTQLMLITFPLTSVKICWSNVTHLTLRNISTEEGLDILQRAPTLKYYEISLSKATFSKPVLHSRLRSLKLTNYIEHFLEAITVPSLEECTQHIGGLHLPVAVMLSLFNRSGCHLKALNLTAVPNDAEGVNTLLQAIPSLERIELSFDLGFTVSNIMDEILTRIFRPPPGSEGLATNSLLPCLQSMHCTSPEAVDPFSWNRIPQLYRLGHRRLLTLKSSAYQSQLTRETALQLLQLADEGVNFQIVDRKFGGDCLIMRSF